MRGYSFSVGTAFLRVQQLAGYNVTVILALTSQQTLCTVQQGGSVDLASEWQLKHLCLQTARLAGSLQKTIHSSVIDSIKIYVFHKGQRSTLFQKVFSFVADE